MGLNLENTIGGRLSAFNQLERALAPNQLKITMKFTLRNVLFREFTNYENLIVCHAMAY
jgi:hypothetical protein